MLIKKKSRIIYWLDILVWMNQTCRGCRWQGIFPGAPGMSATAFVFRRLGRAEAGRPGGEVLGAGRWWKAGWRQFNLSTQSFPDKKPGPSWLSSLRSDEMRLTSGRSLVYGMLVLGGRWHWSNRHMIRVSATSNKALLYCSRVILCPQCWFADLYLLTDNWLTGSMLFVCFALIIIQGYALDQFGTFWRVPFSKLRSLLF